MPPPIALTEEQFLAISAASFPLPPDLRGAFVVDVASALASLPEIGDGALHRVIMVTQRKYFRAPDLGEGSSHKRRQGQGKYW